MKRLVTALVIIMVLSSVLAGCSMVEVDPERDAAIVIAKVSGVEITKGEYNELWGIAMQSYGLTADILNDPAYAESIDGLKDDVINTLIDNKIMEIEAESRGYYDLSQADKDLVMEQVDIILDTYRISYGPSIELKLGDDYTDEEYNKMLDEKIEEFLGANGSSTEDLIESYMNNQSIMNFQEDILDNIIPTSDEVFAKYNELIVADQTTYAAATSYESAILQGATIYYAPEGLRYIKQILIKFDEDTGSNLTSMRTAGDNTSADVFLEESLLVILDEANEALNAVKTGEMTFEEAITEYNDDEGVTTFPEGYIVAPDSQSYVPTFSKGAMDMVSVGDISELVPSDFGYHILMYADDVKAGPIDIALVEADIYNGIMADLKDIQWMAEIDIWTEKYDIKIYRRRIKD